MTAANDISRASAGYEPHPQRDNAFKEGAPLRMHALNLELDMAHRRIDALEDTVRHLLEELHALKSKGQEADQRQAPQEN